jgi:hypothetical protein
MPGASRLSTMTGLSHLKKSSKELQQPKPSVSREDVLRGLEPLLDEYTAVVTASNLSHGSKAMYTDFANCFVRWIRGEFQPGSIGSWKMTPRSSKSGSPMPTAKGAR